MRQELERWNILSHPLSWVGAVWSSLRVHGKHHTPSIWMPKYRSGNQFWLRLQLEIKELNQLLNHNLSKLGKKIREKRKKKNRIQCDAVVEIRKSGISGFIAISSIHSTFRIKQPLVWMCDQCQPTALTPHDAPHGYLVGKNIPGTSILPKNTRKSRSEATPAPSFAQNVIFIHIPAGQRNHFPPFRAHRIFGHQGHVKRHSVITAITVDSQNNNSNKNI